MSGHTFKVGDRVAGKFDGGEAHHATVLALNEGYAWVRLDCGWYRTKKVDRLSPVPLFEPVERWVQVSDNGVIGSNLWRHPGHTNEGWVKVVISPAEDRSAHPSQGGEK